MVLFHSDLDSVEYDKIILRVLFHSDLVSVTYDKIIVNTYGSLLLRSTVSGLWQDNTYGSLLLRSTVSGLWQDNTYGSLPLRSTVSGLWQDNTYDSLPLRSLCTLQMIYIYSTRDFCQTWRYRWKGKKTKGADSRQAEVRNDKGKEAAVATNPQLVIVIQINPHLRTLNTWVLDQTNGHNTAHYRDSDWDTNTEQSKYWPRSEKRFSLWSKSLQNHYHSMTKSRSTVPWPHHWPYLTITGTDRDYTLFNVM